MTTLPVAVSRGFIDVPVALSADYPERGSGNPRITLVGQGDTRQSGYNYVDIASSGMTTDQAGYFYLATNNIGASVLGSSAGPALFVLSPDASSLINVQSGAGFANYRDVAVKSSNNQAFVTSSTGDVIAFALPDLKASKADFLL